METTQPALLPLSVIARLEGVPAIWLRDEADAGRIPCLRAGRRILFDRETVERILLDRARATEAAAT